MREEHIDNWMNPDKSRFGNPECVNIGLAKTMPPLNHAECTMRNFLLFRFGSRRYSCINFDKERLEEGATYVLVKVKLSASRQTYPSAVSEVSGFCDPRTLTLTSS